MRLGRFVFGLCILVLAAQIAGCSSAMKKTTLIEQADKEFAMVNIVRPSLFRGDAMDYDLWDGARFVGVIEAGTIIQYKAKPGRHIFMANGRNWSYVKADLAAGKQYFLKATVLPYHGVILGVADVKSEERIKEWLTYQPKEIADEKREQYEKGKKDSAVEALKELDEGRAEFFELKPANGL